MHDIRPLPFPCLPLSLTLTFPNRPPNPQTRSEYGKVSMALASHHRPYLTPDANSYMARIKQGTNHPHRKNQSSLQLNVLCPRSGTHLRYLGKVRYVRRKATTSPTAHKASRKLNLPHRIGQSSSTPFPPSLSLTQAFVYCKVPTYLRPVARPLQRRVKIPSLATPWFAITKA